MSREHERTIRRVDRGPRALLASLLLSLSPQVPSLVNSLMSVLEPARTSAAELYKPQEQSSTIVSNEINQAAYGVVQSVETGNLTKFLSYFTDNTAWYRVGSSKRPDFIDKPELRKHLTLTFKEMPNCVGLKWEGDSTKYPRFYFKAGDEYFSTWLRPNDEEKRLTLYTLEMIPTTMLNDDLKNLESCPRPESAKDPIFEQVKPLPAGLSGRIAFSSGTKKNNNGFYTDVGYYSTDLKEFKPERFADAGHSGEKLLWSKDGVVVFEKNHEIFSFDTKNGQEKKLIAKKVDGDSILLLECPSIDPKTGRVIISFIFGANDQDIYSISETGSKEQVTRDSLEISETCGAISSDGKHLAFLRSISGSHDPKKTGLVIADYKGSTIDISKEPIFLEGRIMPLEWSLEENKLLALKNGDKRNEGEDTELYLIDPKDKSILTITGGASGATFSPDNKYILYSKNTNEHGQLFLYSLADKKSIKVVDHPFPIWNISWEKERRVIDQKGVILVGGITTETIGGRVGLFTSSIVDSLMLRLKTDMKFKGRGEDIFPFSPEGWEILLDGKINPKSASCDLSFVEIDFRARQLIKFIEFLQDSNPGMELSIITHSEGGVTTDRAFELIKTENASKVDPRRIKGYYSANAPHAGVDKVFIDWVGQHWPIQMADDCLTRWTSLPSLEVFKTPTGKELLAMWNNRDEIRKRLEEVNNWLVKKGVQVVSLVNYQDCAISIRTCMLPEFLIEVRLLTKPHKDEVVLTQRLPGAINIERFFGYEESFGHGDILMRQEGQDMILSLIGEQIGK